MAVEHYRSRYLRFALCGVGALLAHCGVGLALPHGSLHAPAPVSTVWLESLAGSSGVQGQGQPSEGGAADRAAQEAQRARPAPLRRAQGRDRMLARSEASAARVAPTHPTALTATTPAKAVDSPDVREPDASSSASGMLRSAEPPAQAASAAAGTRGVAGSATAARGAGTAGALGAASRATGAGNVADGPGLLAVGAPCAGYFPFDARADQGEVQLVVDVDTTGHTRASAVVEEQPRGEGFGSAARACAQRLRFSPAVDGTGCPVTGHAKLKLRFNRRSSS